MSGVKLSGSVVIKARKALKIYNVPGAPCTLRDRVAFSYSVVDGVTVQEYELTGKASREVNALYRYLSRELRRIV